MTRLDPTRLRQWHSRAAGQLLPRPVVFHHIPKCGGTSVGRALRRRYFLSQAGLRTAASDSALARMGQTETSAPLHPFREAMLLYHLNCGVRAIAMHVGYSPRAYADFAGRYCFATILREPVARFMSQLCWNADHPDGVDGIRGNLREFLETQQAQRMGATMVAYLSGLPPEVPPDHPDSVAAAIGNLAKFDVIGDTDAMGAFHEALSDRLGTRLRIGHENAAGRPTQYQGVYADRIRALCAPDLALWDAYRAQRRQAA
ncbi:MAG: sulfotransferase family 2 domain-containing protein [Marivivens sp.]|nr:sulfotransferase family 2 domain-containing protein [Marivivens sp.]